MFFFFCLFVCFFCIMLSFLKMCVSVDIEALRRPVPPHLPSAGSLSTSCFSLGWGCFCVELGDLPQLEHQDGSCMELGRRLWGPRPEVSEGNKGPGVPGVVARRVPFPHVRIPSPNLTPSLVHTLTWSALALSCGCRQRRGVLKDLGIAFGGMGEEYLRR